MDIKEVNNGSTIQSMFIKAAAGAVGGQMIGGEFASLVTDVSETLSVKTENKNGQVFDDKNIVKPQKDDVRDKNVKEKQKVASEVKSSDKDKASDGVVNKKKFRSDDVTTDNYIADTPKLTEKTNTAIKEGVEIVVSEEGDIVLSESFDINKITPEQVFQVFDATSSEMVQMTGAELSVKLQQASADNKLFVINDVVEAADVLEKVSLEDVMKQERNFKQVQGEVLQTTEQEIDDALLAEQAKFLDDKLGEDKKLKVSVNINEENFSYDDKKELVRDQKVLGEIEAKLLGDKVTVNNNSGVNVASSVLTNADQLQNVQQNDLGNIASLNGVNLMAADVAKIVNVDMGNGSVLADSSVLNSIGTVLEAKSEAGIRMFDNTSRDVFKGMAKEVVDQVKVNITKSAVKGVDKIDIQLKPEDLGNIEIKMQISKDGKLQAHIITSRQETMDILQREVQDLEKAFNDAGFETDNGSFSFSFRGENEEDKNAKLRSFIGGVLEQDADELSVDNDNLTEWTLAQGLNIKV